MAEWAAYERHYGPLLVQDRVDFGMARVAQAFAGGTVMDHLPSWWQRADTIEPADDMIMKMRGLADAWKIRRMNEELENGRSRKHPRSPDRGGRDEPEHRPGSGKRIDEAVSSQPSYGKSVD
jgi:hypothetical protein